MAKRKKVQNKNKSPEEMLLERTDEGVSINLVSSERLDEMSPEEKINFILDEVESGKILVLERGLTPHEEAQLIEATMLHIDPETFIGIEMQSYGVEREKSLLAKWILGNVPRTRMAVIGPANRLTTVRKDSNEIQARVLTAEGVAVS
jgi:uncharacterized protein